jgi:hypothetical protein
MSCCEKGEKRRKTKSADKHDARRHATNSQQRQRHSEDNEKHDGQTGTTLDKSKLQKMRKGKATAGTCGAA